MVRLVAIAKNEGRFIVEWVSHHMSIGFRDIVVYDNESTDETAVVIDALSDAGVPIRRIPWSCSLQESPQRSAYAHAFSSLADVEWMMMMDLDEFFVFRDSHKDMNDWLSTMPSDVAAIGVNWLTYGSSGVRDGNYGLVRDTFRSGCARSFSNNRHIKTIFRPKMVDKVRIHHVELTSGRYVHCDGSPLEMERPGLSVKVEHGVAQINHYQIKSRADFDAKIRRGRAARSLQDPGRFRENAEALWRNIDKQECIYDDIDFNRLEFDEVYGELQKILSEARC